MKAKNLKQSDASGSQKRFHRPRRRHDPMLVFNMSVFNLAKSRECIFNSLPPRGNVWYEKNNIFSVLSQSRRRARNVRPVHCSSKKRRACSVMPTGYIDPRKIVFHRRRVPHQTCGMNWTQELPEDSQIWPRKPSRPSASSKNSLQPQQ
jgi:hypothetical protein